MKDFSLLERILFKDSGFGVVKNPFIEFIFTPSTELNKSWEIQWNIFLTITLKIMMKSPNLIINLTTISGQILVSLVRFLKSPINSIAVDISYIGNLFSWRSPRAHLLWTQTAADELLNFAYHLQCKTYLFKKYIIPKS